MRAIWPEGVNSVNTSGDWEEIEMAVDSGATETVVGEDMLTSVKTVEGEAFKKGVEYEVASGTAIPNFGREMLHCRSRRRPETKDESTSMCCQ